MILRVGRYRKVEVKTYGDEKFCKLSPIPPCGQGLWLYLITGPHTTAIPGLFRTGRAALAEALGWSLEAFDKAFGEVTEQGMAQADWTNRVVWIPKAIKHNKPASPNVITSWAAELELIPECDLKAEAIRLIAQALSEFNPAFSEAFDALVDPARQDPKPLAKPSPKSSRKPSPNQEQEQQQQQKQKEEEAKSLASSALAPLAAAPFISFPLNDGTSFPISEERTCEWQSLYPAIDVRQELRKYKGWADANPAKRKTRRGILGSVNSWLAKSHDMSTNSNLNRGPNGANRAQQRTDDNLAGAARAFSRLTGGTGTTR
jgi:hypothetical protein